MALVFAPCWKVNAILVYSSGSTWFSCPWCFLPRMPGVCCCLSYFSCCIGKIAHHKLLKGERAYVAYSSRSEKQGWRQLLLQLKQIRSKEEWMLAFTSHSSLLQSAGFKPREQNHTLQTVCLPQLILGFTLTIEINHHSVRPSRRLECQFEANPHLC